MNFILGTAQFGLNYGISNNTGQIKINEAKKIINFCKESGITNFDTAQAYGDSENILGSILSENSIITTKIPLKIEDSISYKDWILKCLNKSLKSLNRKSINSLLFHHSEDLLNCSPKETNELFFSLKSKKIINNIGVSIYDFDNLETILKNYSIDVVQVPFNIFDTRLTKQNWLVRMKNEGIQVHVRSAFLQGLLLMDHDKRNEYFNSWKDNFIEFDKFVSSQNQLSKLDYCLQFIKQNNLIDGVIIGVQSEIELKEVYKSFNIKKIIQFRDLSCSDPFLINPSKWKLV